MNFLGLVIYFLLLLLKKIENILWLKVEKNFKWKGVGGLEFILIFILYLL